MRTHSDAYVPLWLRSCSAAYCLMGPYFLEFSQLSPLLNVTAQRGFWAEQSLSHNPIC